MCSSNPDMTIPKDLLLHRLPSQFRINTLNSWTVGNLPENRKKQDKLKDTVLNNDAKIWSDFLLKLKFWIYQTLQGCFKIKY